jgi:hypothetical protein
MCCSSNANGIGNLKEGKDAENLAATTTTG